MSPIPRGWPLATLRGCRRPGRAARQGGTWCRASGRPGRWCSVPTGTRRSRTRSPRKIVAWVATGRSNDEIAAELHLSPATVRTHVGRAMTKTAARPRPTGRTRDPRRPAYPESRARLKPAPVTRGTPHRPSSRLSGPSLCPGHHPADQPAKQHPPVRRRYSSPCPGWPRPRTGTGARFCP